MEESSEARYNAAFAISSGWANLPIGIVDKNNFLVASTSFFISSVKKLGNIGVSAATGLIQLTLILNGANSIANDLVRKVTAAFDAA